MSEPRAEATESDGVLRCYLDQLPPTRCIVCGGPAEGAPRDKLPMCAKCAPKVALPLILGALVAGSSILFAVLNNFAREAVIQMALGTLLGAGCVGVAAYRMKLRRSIGAGERLALRSIPGPIVAEVKKLGAGVHPKRALAEKIE